MILFVIVCTLALTFLKGFGVDATPAQRPSFMTPRSMTSLMLCRSSVAANLSAYPRRSTELAL